MAGDGGGERAPPCEPSGTCLVVAAEADGVAPSVLLTCARGARRQYLFSCAEGFSRLALECRARPTGKLRAAFLPNHRPRASGGLGGLFLASAPTVTARSTSRVPGRRRARRRPPRLRPLPTSRRHHLRLVPPDAPVARDQDDPCDAAAETYRDDSVLVFPLFPGQRTCQLCHARDDDDDDDDEDDEDDEIRG